MEGVWKRGRQGGWRPVKKRRIYRGKGGEEQARMWGLLAIWGHGDIQFRAAAKGHYWVCGPAAALICVDLCPWFQLSLKAVSMPGIWAAICGHIGAQGPCQCSPIPMWVAWAATQGFGDVWAWAAAKAMSGSMALPQPGSSLISKAPVALEDLVGTQGLGPHLGLCCCLRVILQPGWCLTEWPALHLGP